MKTVTVLALALLCASCATCRERPGFCAMTGALIVGAAVVASKRPPQGAAAPTIHCDLRQQSHCFQP